MEAAASSPKFEPDDPATDMPMLAERAPEPARTSEMLAAPAPMQVAEVASYEAIRPSVVATFDQTANFEGNDLDVPAFLRKGREIM